MNEPVIIGPCTLYCGSCFDIMPTLQSVNTVISDPPFSAKTHTGHDNGRGGYDGSVRGNLGYAAWTSNDAFNLCAFLPSSGWACILTDHVLARDWENAMKAKGRYVFAPLPLLTRGRSVRLNGDGPCSWTDWLVVSRTTKESKWGTLPGFYEGRCGSIEHMGGKPLDAMCRIVEDYSREGDTVLDFCMGAATTGIACIRTGRKFIGIEKDPEHFATAVERITRELEQTDMFTNPVSERQMEDVPLL